MTKILVTGGAGFIGSAVVRLALARGYEIINLDSLTYAGCQANLNSVDKDPNYTFIRGDIRSPKDINSTLEYYQPTAIMHLAAESHVDRSIDGPREFIDTNITGTYNLLESARKYWNQRGQPDWFRFHHISTDEVFGTLGDTGFFTEETPYSPNSPYSASKAASDHLVRAWHQTYGLPIVLSNCSNNYGPYQFPEKLIPVIIINALAGKPLPIYGKGENVRDWLYVDDHAKALLLVMENGRTGRSYNIGGENEATNIEIVKKVCAILDKENPGKQTYSNLISYVEDRPGHDQRYAIDSSRIKKELGWFPSVSLDEGLKKTVKWYLSNEKWWRSLQEDYSASKRLGIME